MNDAIMAMIDKYTCKSSEDYENALKEVVQEVALMGLSRSDFFTKAAFYGGTALRIFYGLPMYSEDLDFSLERPEADFDLDKYLSYVKKELISYNFKMTVKKKNKSKQTAIQSAFIKGNTIQNILEITSDDSMTYGFNSNALIRIKFEIDTNPPGGAEFQYVNAILPDTYRAKLYDMPSLFAGKIHAVLCRDYKNRVKGRDFFDYIWYLKRGTRVNIYHLQKRMEQSDHWAPSRTLDIGTLKNLLNDRFKVIDFDNAREDVLHFLGPKEQKGLSIWDADFFTDITDRYLEEQVY